MSVKIKGSFKTRDGDVNGLNHIESELRAEPLGQRLVIGVITVARQGQNYEKGERETTVKFELIEPLLGEAADEGKKLLDLAHAARTGRPEAPQGTLPFDHADLHRIEQDGDDISPDDEQDPTAGPWPGDPGFSHREP